MVKFILFISVFITLCACKNEAKKKPVKKDPVVKTNSLDSINNTPEATLINYEKNKIKNEVKYDNGLIIKWLENGKGAKLKSSEVVLIEYRLALPDGKIIDGNQRVGLPFIPFMIGFNMQTLGWDLALTELKVGDFVKVEIPAYLARGSKGIPGIIPPNSTNWLYMKIIARVSPEYDLNGIKTWTFAQGVETEVIPGRKNEIEYNALVSTASNPSVLNTYRAKFPLKYVAGQMNVVPGLRKVLSNVKKGQKMYVLLEANQAYGSRGYVDLIKPNESVFFNITVKDIRPI